MAFANYKVLIVSTLVLLGLLITSNTPSSVAYAQTCKAGVSCGKGLTTCVPGDDFYNPETGKIEPGEPKCSFKCDGSGETSGGGSCVWSGGWCNSNCSCPLEGCGAPEIPPNEDPPDPPPLEPGPGGGTGACNSPCSSNNDCAGGNPACVSGFCQDYSCGGGGDVCYKPTCPSGAKTNFCNDVTLCDGTICRKKSAATPNTVVDIDLTKKVTGTTKVYYGPLCNKNYDWNCDEATYNYTNYVEPYEGGEAFISFDSAQPIPYSVKWNRENPTFGHIEYEIVPYEVVKDILDIADKDNVSFCSTPGAQCGSLARHKCLFNCSSADEAIGAGYYRDGVSIGVPQYSQYYVRMRGKHDACGNGSNVTYTRWYEEIITIQIPQAFAIWESESGVMNGGLCTGPSNAGHRGPEPKVFAESGGVVLEGKYGTWKNEYTVCSHKASCNCEVCVDKRKTGFNNTGNISAPVSFDNTGRMYLDTSSIGGTWTCSCPQGCTFTDQDFLSSKLYNFYLSQYTNGWWQSAGGDIHAQGSFNPAISSQIPGSCSGTCKPNISLRLGTTANSSAVITKADTGAVKLGAGTKPDEDQRTYVANSTYNGKRENFAYFKKLVQLPITPKEDWPSETITKPTLPSINTIPGVFFVSGNAQVNAPWSVAAGESYVVFVQGNLDINATINVDPGGFLAFIVSNDIEVNPTVGNADYTLNTGVVEGIYIADGGIVTGTTGLKDDLRFVGEGSFIAWDGIVMERQLTAAGNLQYAGDYFVFRPDLLLNTPDILKSPLLLWQEVAP